MLKLSSTVYYKNLEKYLHYIKSKNEEVKFMLSHARRIYNLIILIKCN